MARRHSSSRPVSSPRLTQWVGPADQGFLSVASAGATLLASFQPVDRVTVIRVRGQVSIIPEDFTADIEIIGAFGIMVVSNEAFAAGVTSIPEPFSNGDGDWMVWRSFSYRFEFGSGNSGFAFPDWYFEIDSKAMRKIGPNQVMVLIAESQAGAYQISVPVRTLIKLA